MHQLFLYCSPRSLKNFKRSLERSLSSLPESVREYCSNAFLFDDGRIEVLLDVGESVFFNSHCLWFFGCMREEHIEVHVVGDFAFKSGFVNIFY